MNKRVRKKTQSMNKNRNKLQRMIDNMIQNTNNKVIRIPEVMKLNKDVSVKYGILALGMGGCSVGAAIGNCTLQGNVYPYKALLVNTNVQDFNKLDIKNPNTTKKYVLEGYEDGAGRDIEVGEEAFIQHKDKILEEIKKHFEGCDFVWVSCGLGGGTGTGSLFEATNLLYSEGFDNRIGLILTLPMDDEGGKVMQNAITQLKNIVENKDSIGAILVVDNQKIYNEYKKDRATEIHTAEFLEYCNTYVADILHEINIVTKNYSPIARDNFDSSEYKRLLQQPGFLTLVRQEFENSTDLSKDVANTTRTLSDAINAGVLSDGYDFEYTKRAALALITNNKTATTNFSVALNDSLSEMMNKYASHSSEKPIALYSDDALAEKAVAYAAFSGLNLPERVSTLMSKYKDYVINTKTQNAKKDPILEALSTFDIDIDIPTVEKVEEEPKKSLKKANRLGVTKEVDGKKKLGL